MQRAVKELNMLAQIEKLIGLVWLLLQGPFVVVAVENTSFGLHMCVFERGREQLHLITKLRDLLEHPAIAPRVVLEDRAMKFLDAEPWLPPAEKQHRGRAP